MTQEDKQLLLKDLCGRLPYGVVYHANLFGRDENFTLNATMVACWLRGEKVRARPYLRPLSSMTEEEREEFWKEVLDIDWRELEFDEEPDEVPFPFTENDCGFYLDFIYLADLFSVFDWLNEHHFDYRGLIEKGLALSTEEFNPYK